MLVMADAKGIVRASSSGLVRRAHISEDAFRRSIKTLESPDLDSKDQDYGGRRIEKVDGGWLVLNYKKYREIRTMEQMRAADRQQRRRDRERDASRDEPNVTASHAAPASASASQVPDAEAPVADAKSPEVPAQGSGLHAIAKALAATDKRAQQYLDRQGPTA